ncbi:MAG TPA: carbon-nitrogen hydrolase family protein [Phototrophicaceae bacterium]|jgi:predicted amidohydrolase|nr:carbon-nitrogen hydrolase family protein [Phototrophicaceae bacterium]
MTQPQSKQVRVAAAQFYTGTDVAANLATVLRMIGQAAEFHPDILVLPEFCNHSSWYRDRDYSYQVTVELDAEDPFLEAVGRKVAEVGFYVMVNCTVRRPNQTVTGTNILFDPTGQIIAHSDKQVLMGNENNFLTKAQEVCPIIETPHGKIGMYSCMDGVIFETPRSLALRGGQILLNSLNSFALDEASLHVPTRAGENKVFIVAANKVGLLVPEPMAEAIAERVKLRPDQLHGAGESQIVAPDGTVLAKAPLYGEVVIYADIDPTLADDKCRPDGTDLFAARTPERYTPLAQPPKPRDMPPAAPKITAAVVTDETLLTDTLTQYTDLALIVLPPDTLTDNPEVWAERLRQHDTEAVIASADTDGGGFFISRAGVTRCLSLKDAPLTTLDLPWGRVALLSGTDAQQPEAFRLCALHEVQVVVCPVQVQEAWELGTAYPERAAENRMSVIVATPSTPVGTSSSIAASAIITISEDFTLWTEWKNRPFDGSINAPIVTRMDENKQRLVTELYPANSANRLVSQQTDVVDGRPYWLLEALL